MSRKTKVSRIRGTGHLSKLGYEVEPIRELILKRRLQLLVHSCIYYKLNNNLVSDKVWDSWAKELVKLQKLYPTISRAVDYYDGFKNFDGTTGFDLPFHKPEILNKAMYLIKLNKPTKIRLCFY